MRLSMRMPCQWMVVGIWISFVTRTTTVAFWGAWISGPVGATPVTTLYADPARRQPQGPAPEQLRLDLRCVDLLCVFAVTRNWQGRQANQQAVLFPDMSVQQWRDIVHTTTRALYP